MERFCESGNDASRIEELQSAVRNGSRSSMTSWRRNVGTGSSSQDFGGEERISRRSSVLEISWSACSRCSVEENIGERLIRSVHSAIENSIKQLREEQTGK